MRINRDFDETSQHYVKFHQNPYSHMKVRHRLQFMKTPAFSRCFARVNVGKRETLPISKPRSVEPRAKASNVLDSIIKIALSLTCFKADTGPVFGYKNYANLGLSTFYDRGPVSNLLLCGLHAD
ncbi:hypothetical protein EVAR_78767_1 [Eumeta japonica]|uniref:Uncharacterized protein n=1 Tax=Eumeta variegata TaxID=151549 RepID=A0A4C1T1I5_EUMVA|nr:hypothetical protein EVAR_78767_1 [Eumeta japonica]